MLKRKTEIEYKSIFLLVLIGGILFAVCKLGWSFLILGVPLIIALSSFWDTFSREKPKNNLAPQQKQNDLDEFSRTYDYEKIKISPRKISNHFKHEINHSLMLKTKPILLFLMLKQMDCMKLIAFCRVPQLSMKLISILMKL